MFDYFDQIATTLLGQSRHWNTDKFALRSRIQAQISITNGFFNLGRHTFFPRLHTQRSGINQGDVRNCIYRHHGAVIVDLNMVKQSNMSTPSTNLRQIMLEHVERLQHFVFSSTFHIRN